MLLDLRRYTCHPGKLAEFLQLVEAEILPIQRKHCGNLVFYSTTETGELNQVVQVWAYRDSADRDARRAALWADPAWQALAARAMPLIQRQENTLLRTTGFSPMKWA
jgi:hypothetical protein